MFSRGCRCLGLYNGLPSSLRRQQPWEGGHFGLPVKGLWLADPGRLVDGAGGSASSGDDEFQALTVVLHGPVMFLSDYHSVAR